MIPKESPTDKGRDSQEGCSHATSQDSHDGSRKAISEKAPPRKVPRQGCKTRILLDKLRNATGREVSLSDLGARTHLAAVHSGVSTLRGYGWNITNRMERHPFNGGTEVHSFYKLEEDPR